MSANLSRGKPYQSRFRELLPDAVALRKSGATWTEIAARLSERAGEPVPLTTLYDAATKWIRRHADLEALPDPTPTTSAGLTRATSFSSDSMSESPPLSRPCPGPPRDDLDEEPARGPVIKINRNSNSADSTP